MCGSCTPHRTAPIRTRKYRYPRPKGLVAARPAGDEAAIRPVGRPLLRSRSSRRGAHDRMTTPRTIVEKIWDDHVVAQEPGAPAILAVDLHLVHEVTRPRRSPACAPAASASATRSGPSRRRTTPPDPRRATCPSSTRWPRPRSTSSTRNCDEFGIPLHGLGSPNQGIVHVIGPQLGLTQPGHDDRLRRLAHRDPRRVRGARVRDRDERGRDGPRDPDAAPAPAEDLRGPGRRPARARASARRTSSSP